MFHRVPNGNKQFNLLKHSTHKTELDIFNRFILRIETFLDIKYERSATDIIDQLKINYKIKCTNNRIKVLRPL
jgi:hypothetical protein